MSRESTAFGEDTGKHHHGPFGEFKLSTDVNEAAIKHYGYSRQEFLKMTIADIRPEEETELLRKSESEGAGSIQNQNRTWIHRKKDGTLIEVEVSGFRLCNPPTLRLAAVFGEQIALTDRGSRHRLHSIVRFIQASYRDRHHHSFRSWYSTAYVAQD